tara:strand:- start:1055 stop:1279 length:225 start_codon:yes stop_codon:yes gene_type:complete
MYKTFTMKHAGMLGTLRGLIGGVITYYDSEPSKEANLKDLIKAEALCKEIFDELLKANSQQELNTFINDGRKQT